VYYFEKAIDRARVEHDWRVEEAAHFEAGITSMTMGLPDKFMSHSRAGIAVHDAAAARHEQSADNLDTVYVQTLQALGNELNVQHKYEESRAVLNKAFNYDKEMGDTCGECEDLILLAERQLSLGHVRPAMLLLQDALKLCAASGQDEGLWRAHRLMASYYLG